MKRVSCYNCDRSVLLDNAESQRCPACQVVLFPVPSWAKDAGWPEKSLSKRHHRRVKYHAVVPLKQIRFKGEENVALARRLEAIVHVDGVRMNDLLLSLLRDGLEQRRKEGRA